MGGPLGVRPAGCPGVETLAPLILDQMTSGRLSPERVAWLLSEGTARRYGVYPRKGSLRVAADADVTVVDPTRSLTISRDGLHSLQPVSPWDGVHVQGVPVATIVRGRLVMNDGEIDGTPHGRVVRPLSEQPRLLEVGHVHG
jgi:dihydroorotase-like cyclic amidohydrolase